MLDDTQNTANILIRLVINSICSYVRNDAFSALLIYLEALQSGTSGNSLRNDKFRLGETDRSTLRNNPKPLKAPIIVSWILKMSFSCWLLPYRRYWTRNDVSRKLFPTNEKSKPRKLDYFSGKWFIHKLCVSFEHCLFDRVGFDELSERQLENQQTPIFVAYI